MPSRYTLLLGYLMVVNLITFLLFGLDKMKARRKSRRIPEGRLFLFSLLGGALGGLLGMRVFRHKTRKRGFKIVMVLMLVVNMVVYYYIFTW